MDIILNEKLRALRRAKDMTQAELAEKLNVSVQAVSKWERNEGYPDITMLPQLARFFDVSIDELMGMEEKRMKEKIEAYRKESQSYKNRGEVEKNIALWEKALEEFPCEVEVKLALMHALFSKDIENERIITLGEELLRDPKLGKDREFVIQLLALSHNHRGENEKAKEYAESAHFLHTSRELLLASVLEGKEGAEQAQQNILTALDDIHRDITMSNRKLKRSPADCIHAWEICIQLFETVFENGDYGFYACRMRRMHDKVASGYAVLKNAEKTLDALEKAAKFAIMSDTAEGCLHTSLLIDQVTYAPAETTKNYSHNDSYGLLQSLKKDKIFDFIREDARFIAVMEKLEAVAK